MAASGSSFRLYHSQPPQNVSTLRLAYCDYKVEKTRHFCRVHWMSESSKAFSFSGLRPLTPDLQGLCPWTPLGAPPPDPRYRLALGGALATCPSQSQFLDPPLGAVTWKLHILAPHFHCRLTGGGGLEIWSSPPTTVQGLLWSSCFCNRLKTELFYGASA